MSGQTARAFAPATVANVATGFDILGFPIEAAGDTVTVTKTSEPGVLIEPIAGFDLPLDAAKNCAGVGLLQMIADLSLPFGFRVNVKKGIPLGSGMGGSAASSVAAIVAANALLDHPLGNEQMLPYALLGETLASGSAHADNVAPCLWGGLTLIQSLAPLKITSLPFPATIYCVVVHPNFVLATRDSRAALSKSIALTEHVRQSASLGALIAGCYTNNVNLIRDGLNDVIIEPQRAKLIPGFAAAKAAALSAGALGFSISGSGPSVFALVEGQALAQRVADAVAQAFATNEIRTAAWISPISTRGARVVP